MSSSIAPEVVAFINRIGARRFPNIITDYLSPTPSHLLEVLVGDLFSEGVLDYKSRVLETSNFADRRHVSLKAAEEARQRGLGHLKGDEGPGGGSRAAAAAAATCHLPPHGLPMRTGHHFAYFPLQDPVSRLSPDGADAGHGPGGRFTRRLWKGGRISWGWGVGERLVMDGRVALAAEEVCEVRHSGRDGESGGGGGEDSVAVDVWRGYGIPESKWDEVTGGRRTDMSASFRALMDQPAKGRWVRKWMNMRVMELDPVVTERRSLVFTKTPEKPAEQRPRMLKSPVEPALTATCTPTINHLFTFSALSHNAHRIHYDPLFARQTDNHPAPLVQGSLATTLMLSLASTALLPTERPVALDYRNLLPLYADQQMRVCVGPGIVAYERGLTDPRSAPGAAPTDRPRPASGRTDGKTALVEVVVKRDVWIEGPDGGLRVRGVLETARLLERAVLRDGVGFAHEGGSRAGFPSAQGRPA